MILVFYHTAVRMVHYSNTLYVAIETWAAADTNDDISLARSVSAP